MSIGYISIYNLYRYIQNIDKNYTKYRMDNNWISMTPLLITMFVLGEFKTMHTWTGFIIFIYEINFTDELIAAIQSDIKEAGEKLKLPQHKIDKGDNFFTSPDAFKLWCYIY